MIGYAPHKWLRFAMAAATICTLSGAMTGRAQAQEAPKPDAPKPADATPPAPDPDKVTLNFFKGTELGGLVDTYYLWNSTRTAPLYRSFDT